MYNYHLGDDRKCLERLNMMGINTIITLDKLIEWSEKWQILFHF